MVGAVMLVEEVDDTVIVVVVARATALVVDVAPGAWLVIPQIAKAVEPPKTPTRRIASRRIVRDTRGEG